MQQKSPINLLITGGAGFIGSNLVKHFLNESRISKIRVLDDLSNGYYDNIKEFEENPKFEFIKGDITDYQVCLRATEGMDMISHQAALGSVPRSIENPMRTTEVNVLGTVNVLYAAVENGIKRVVLACSSSTYGDHPGLPKVEDKIGRPLSPYGMTKLSVEFIAEVFMRTYGLNFIGLRYFNIFGPRQNPDNPYAAVIPLFCKAFLQNQSPVINGDGKNSRDFTYVDNAVSANKLALYTDNAEALNQIYNVAVGDQVNLNEVVSFLREISGKDIKAVHGPERPGDIRHSKADISKICNQLDYQPLVNFKEGLESVYNWYKQQGTFGE